MRTGTMDLPLHSGRCPPWLFSRMKSLSHEISAIIINTYGTRELLLRLSSPVFFQALGCALGFDWHSSGLTTTTCGALKEALSAEIGVVAAGGKGKTGRETILEIGKNAERFGIPEENLRKASILTAKVDSSCIQAGYDLYHHSFFFDEEGNWAVVQQGMNAENKYARRYHWFNASAFVDGPDNKITGTREKEALNLVSEKSGEARKAAVDLVKDNPARLQKYFSGQATLFDAHHSLPARHEILPCDLGKKDWEALHAAYELQPENYEELVCIRGMGKKKLRALALLSKLIYGTELDWNDPVKYSFAHGGKDGIPYPVDMPAYDDSISFLKEVIRESKSGEKTRALQRLSTLC